MIFSGGHLEFQDGRHRYENKTGIIEFLILEDMGIATGIFILSVIEVEILAEMDIFIIIKGLQNM